MQNNNVTDDFIQTYNVSVGSILALTINNLTPREQVELLERLQTYLSNQEILDSAMIAASNIGEIISKAQRNLTL